MGDVGKRPSAALIVALVALVAALAGTAVALPGKNSVDKNDIKKNAVKSKAIKNNQVKAADIKTGAVGAAEIADGTVGAAELTDPEALHVVGAAGEPGYGNGVEGDCLWSSIETIAGPDAPKYQPPAFYMDSDGRVHLSGTAISDDGGGGDGECGPAGEDSDEDAVAFVLPPGYRPAKNEYFFSDSGGELGAIVAAVDTDVGDGLVPAGGVFLATNLDNPFGFGALGGISFRAATPAVARANAQKPAAEVRGPLRKLLR